MGYYSSGSVRILHSQAITVDRFVPVADLPIVGIETVNSHVSSLYVMVTVCVAMVYLLL